MQYLPLPDRRPEARPEVIAAEQRVLTFADALLTWMRSEEVDRDLTTAQRISDTVVGFFTHTSRVNPGCGVDDPALGKTKVMILDKLDGDANRLMFELLRAAWERRCWRSFYGEIEETRRL